MSEALIVLEDLTICAPDRVLVEAVSLTVERGRITALIGPSGSGKTLTARAMMGVVDVSPGLISGRLLYPARHPGVDWFEGVLGNPSAHHGLGRRTASLRGAYVTYAPQSASSALNPARTVGRQLEIAIGRRDQAPEEVGPVIATLLDEVGLPRRAAAMLPGALSGGMAQRAAVAVAIAPEPAVLLADEPETGLDPILRRRMLELLVEVGRRHEAGLVVITHHAETVERIADHIVRLGGEP